MATVTRTFSFPTDAMGLAAASGGSASLSFGWVNDGIPAGAVRFLCSTNRLSGASLTARVASPTDTWQSWGVPAGATVTGLTVTGWQKKMFIGSALTAATIKIDVVDATGAMVYPAGNLISATLAVGGQETSYSAGAAGSLVAVDPSHQASSTVVGIRLTFVASTGSGSGANVDYRFDEIALEMTYTPPAGGGPPGAARRPRRRPPRC